MDRWSRLNSKNSGLPDLLIKGHYDSAGYTIQLTDLSRVWEEKLTKKKIIHRAVLEECSIDPTEGDDQYQILQQKISSAILQEEGTILRISQHGKDGLKLELSAPVPPRVPPFWWKVELSLSHNENIEREIVTPLIRQAQGLYRCIDLLITELHDKDRVISKITDRLEQSGNDLTTVFPGVSNIKTNRKRSQREQLAKHVKGLADFEEKSWRTQHQMIRIDDALPGDWTAILSDLPPARSSSLDASEWWKGVYSEIKGGEAGPVDEDFDPNGGPKQQNESASKLDVDTNMQDAEFQRQDTPSRIQKIPAHRSLTESPANGQESALTVEDPPPLLEISDKTVASDDDESTDDEEVGDLDAPSHRRFLGSQSVGKALVDRTQDRIPETQIDEVAKTSNTTGQAKRIEAFGGSRPSPEQEIWGRQSPTPESRPALGNFGGKPTKSLSPEPTPEPPKTRSKLGTIGGKKQDEVEEKQSESSPAPRQAQRKLGAFGGRQPEPQDGNASIRNSRLKHEKSPAPTYTKTFSARSATPEETAAQKAERLRNELKRSLEQQKQAPAKKKRKF